MLERRYVERVERGVYNKGCLKCFREFMKWFLLISGLVRVLLFLYGVWEWLMVVR